MTIVTLFFTCTAGCTHRIHVVPTPPIVSPVTIAQSLRVQVPFLAVEGADHMPGITLLDWPAKDLQTAIVEYIQQRQTFSSVDSDEGTWTMVVKTWLWMRSRAEYRYTVRLEAELGPTGKQPIKSYLIQKEAAGSRVRWTTTSDQDPIAEAVQRALDDLLLQIEEDAGLLAGKT